MRKKNLYPVVICDELQCSRITIKRTVLFWIHLTQTEYLFTKYIQEETEDRKRENEVKDEEKNQAEGLSIEAQTILRIRNRKKNLMLIWLLGRCVVHKYKDILNWKWNKRRLKNAMHSYSHSSVQYTISSPHIHITTALHTHTLTCIINIYFF